MHYYEPVSFKMLRHQYGTPTFKTNAFRLVSNEGRKAKTSFTAI